MTISFYPQNMETYNNSSLSNPYKTWKGTGKYSNPIGITSGAIRPLTNNDLTNIAVYKQGSARPLKWQFRKGIIQKIPYTIINPENPNQYINMDRMSNSSSGLSSKNNGLIGQLMDRPAGYSISQNQSNSPCTNYDGIQVISDVYPSPNLTNNPQDVCTTPQYCCNQSKKALLRVRPASTILKKDYYNTNKQYRQNRCNTYEQRIFNFKSENDFMNNALVLKNNPNITESMIANAKPGSPLTTLNTYYTGNCYPNAGKYSQLELVVLSFQIILNKDNTIFSTNDITNYYNLNINTLEQFVLFISNLQSGNSSKALYIFNNFINNPYYGMDLSGPSNTNGCKLLVYKPNNSQFAIQGAVSSSSRTIKLGLNTIKTNINDNHNKFIYKLKVQSLCNK